MEIQGNVANQQTSFEQNYQEVDFSKWFFHTTKDPFIRYLRDRRMKIAIDFILKELSTTIEAIQDWKVLIVCGGVGGEGRYLANRGFRSVTISDFSENALTMCRRMDSRLQTLLLNAEKIDLEDNTFDLVMVQDGLHHLPRPALGLTEMLRVSRKAVVVIEPHTSLVGTLVGTEWERQDGSVNYVFRWNQNILEQITKSCLLFNTTCIKAIQLWDHNLVINKTASKFPKEMKLSVAKFIYAILNLFSKVGNMMVGVVIKGNSKA
ncbi:MAG: class I SAM-dependent methyltransferase [Bacteroidota bacterium]